MVKCDLNHSCRNGAVRVGEEATEGPSERKRSVKLDVIQAADSKVLESHVVQKASRKHTKQAAMVADNVNEEGLVQVTTAMMRKFLERENGDRFVDSMEEMVWLTSFILDCRRQDPQGYYCLDTVPLSYPVEGVVHGPRSNERQFHRLIVVPSASKDFFDNSRKQFSLDGCHLTGRFDGVQLSVTAMDANNQIVKLAYAIVSCENKDNWSAFTELLFAVFRELSMLISDKDKGLQHL